MHFVCCSDGLSLSCGHRLLKSTKTHPTVIEGELSETLHLAIKLKCCTGDGMFYNTEIHYPITVIKVYWRPLFLP